MLFDAKPSGVDVEREFAQGKSPAGKSLPRPAEGEDEQLGHDISDGKGWVAKAEELVGTGKDDDENRGQDPCSECCWRLDVRGTRVTMCLVMWEGSHCCKEGLGRPCWAHKPLLRGLS